MSLSRGALLTLLAVLPLLFWFGRTGPEFRRRAPLLLLILVATYSFVKFGPFEERRGIETLLLAPGEQIEKDPALSARLLMWRSTWRIIQDSNPIIGTGLGTYKTYYVAYREEMETSGNLAHNDYLQGLQEGGAFQLGFFLLLTAYAPLWLLHRARSNNARNGPCSEWPGTTGLMLGVVCVSLHAVINFVHYVAPIAMLTGLYLARAWESIRPRDEFCLLPTGGSPVKSHIAKGLAITLLAIPTVGLVLDGAIFKMFSGTRPIFDQLDSATRIAVRSTTLALRPGNPYPRASLIQDLIGATALSPPPETRARLLDRAEEEADVLARLAPGLATGRFFRGKIRAMKGTTEDLALARGDLEYAVERVPAATGMRLELVRVYERLGLDERAYQTVRAAKKWITLETDVAPLVAFAKEARSISLKHGDHDEAKFWTWVASNVGTGGDGETGG